MDSGDAWAIGIKGRYTVGVWIGCPDGTPVPGQYGAVTAIPLLAQVMGSLRPGPDSNQPPATVTKETVCWPSGLSRSRMETKHTGKGRGFMPETI